MAKKKAVKKKAAKKKVAPKKKATPKKKTAKKGNLNKKLPEDEDNSFSKKFALILFSIGPLLLVGWFLFSKGFFDPM